MQKSKLALSAISVVLVCSSLAYSAEPVKTDSKQVTVDKNTVVQDTKKDDKSSTPNCANCNGCPMCKEKCYLKTK
jgi:radical SAM protein with 4Fe4S-binding SPASM domain